MLCKESHSRENFSMPRCNSRGSKITGPKMLLLRTVFINILSAKIWHMQTLNASQRFSGRVVVSSEAQRNGLVHIEGSTLRPVEATHRPSIRHQNIRRILSNIQLRMAAL